MPATALGRGRVRVAAGVLSVAIAVTAAGCSSGASHVGAGNPGSSSTAAPGTSAPPTTLHEAVPTVGNCGGGAYKPSTLLIVCGIDSTMATGVQWKSWDQTRASGTGTVHVRVSGQPAQGPAQLTLTQPVDGAVGKQFSQLTVTWIGSSPDGHPSDVYHLAPGA